jgi:hypothetical protein
VIFISVKNSFRYFGWRIKFLKLLQVVFHTKNALWTSIFISFHTAYEKLIYNSFTLKFFSLLVNLQTYIAFPFNSLHTKQHHTKKINKCSMTTIYLIYIKRRVSKAERRMEKMLDKWSNIKKLSARIQHWSVK